MGERRLATRMAVKPVAAASQATRNTTLKAADDAMRVQTPGGVFSVRWDERGRATALGQLAKAQPGACAARSDGLARRHVTGLAPEGGSGRLRVWQRGRDERT